MVDFSTVAHASLPHAQELLHRWLPNGIRHGTKWVALNHKRTDNNPSSFKVNCDTGAWADFSTSDKGGDFTSLAAFLFDLPQHVAAEYLGSAVGLGEPETAIPAPLAEAFAPVAEDFVMLEPEEEGQPLPADEGPPDSFLQAAGMGLPGCTWLYKNRAGKVVFAVCRWEKKPHGKNIRQATPWAGADGNLVWKWRGMGGNRPLFGLPELLDHPQAPVCIVEGEKSMEAARSLVPRGWLVTTWSGGAQAVNKTDWSPLAGRLTLVWPDADEAGKAAGKAIAIHLPRTMTAGESFFTSLRNSRGLGKELPQGWDAADALAEGFTQQDFHRLFTDESAERLKIVDIADLIADHPNLHAPIIEGLLRRGETVNVIGAPKTGKSWAVLNLAASIATGREWLGFTCKRGRVLIIDNELHPETLSDRLKTVLRGMEITPEEVTGKIGIVNLRGRLSGLDHIAKELATIPDGTWDAVVIDALYRAMPKGTDENSNSDASALYNLIDSTAGRLGAAFILIHHSSKGNQSGKGTTDVGAGAGAQSRAADTHLVLRPHADKGQVVLDAVARSWPQPEPRVLTWNANGLWEVVDGADPTRLAGTKDAGDHSAAIGILMGVLDDNPTSLSTLKATARKRRVKWTDMEAALMEEEAEGRAFKWTEKRNVVWSRKPQPEKAPTKTEQIQHYLTENPDAKTSEIAEKFGVHPTLVRTVKKTT